MGIKTSFAKTKQSFNEAWKSNQVAANPLKYIVAPTSEDGKSI
jgi:hypothetical protein